MDIITSSRITDYLSSQENIFKVDDFVRFLRTVGIKVTKNQAFDILHNSNYVFPLVNDEYVTRAGVFTKRWFSIKPTREEIQKDRLLIGHRCLPFVNPDISPEDVHIYAMKKKQKQTTAVFSMNLAMDLYALYGEGYVLPYIINDSANKDVQLTSVQFSLPTEIELTCWKLSEICGKKIKNGDRLLCRVVDWQTNTVEVVLLENSKDGLSLTPEAIERENWYTDFENGLLKSFDKNGPVGSIEEQLALLFLENQESLCQRSCGSCEEFLQHTKKIGFVSYGVESRIWKENEQIPYVGEWNKLVSKDLIMAELSTSFSPQVIDSYLNNYFYEKNKLGIEGTIEDIVNKIFPPTFKMNNAERKLVLLNIERRNAILEKQNKQFFDYKMGDLRKRLLDLFSKVSSLLCSIGCSKLPAENFPQQELIVLTQLFGHIIKMIEEIENVFVKDSFPIDDVNLSLDGMEETFYEIESFLRQSLDDNISKGFELVK